MIRDNVQAVASTVKTVGADWRVAVRLAPAAENLSRAENYL
jgi:hypothetical protein